MRCPALAWFAAAAPLLLAGCDAQLETRTVCTTLTGVAFPGAAGAGTVATDLGYDLGSSLPVLARQGVSYSLTLQDLELSPAAGSGVSDLGGLRELDVSVLPPAASSLPQVELIRYVNETGGHPTRIQAAAERQVDLQPYLSDGVVDFRVDATGTLPSRPWAADARACFSLDVNVRY